MPPPKPINFPRVELVDLGQALPLLDSIEFACQDWLDRRKNGATDIFLMWAALHAMSHWVADGLNVYHGMTQEQAKTLAPVIITCGKQLSFMMAQRRAKQRQPQTRSEDDDEG